MVKVMGLWSLASTVCGTSEVIIDGLTGSVEKIKIVGDEKQVQ